MQSCLKICGDCGSAKNGPGWSRTGTRKSRAPSGVAARHARRPDVEKPRPPSSAESPRPRVAREPEVALHPLACAGRASGSGGAASRRRPPRRAGTGAASSARRSRARRPGARPRPVGIFGLTVSGERATTSPLARSTNSLRISFASSAAAGERSGLTTSCMTPVWSRRSTKTSPPWSRRARPSRRASASARRARRAARRT